MMRVICVLAVTAQVATAFSFSSPPALRARTSASVSAVKCDMQSATPSRRAALFQGGAVLAAPFLAPALCNAASAAPAAAAAGASYKDASQGIEFMVPSGWKQQEAVFPGGANDPASPKIVAFVSDNKDINMALVSYSIRSDNAKLGSFGGIADVRKNIVRSNARSVEGEIVAE